MNHPPQPDMPPRNTTHNPKATESVPDRESFASRDARLQAHKILQNWEMLAWHASARDESIPQTRLYYTKILHGINPDSPEPMLTDARFGDVLSTRLKNGTPTDTAAAALGSSSKPTSRHVSGSGNPPQGGVRSPRSAADKGSEGSAAAATVLRQGKRKSEGRG